MFKCLLLIVVLSASSTSMNVEAMPNPGSKNCRCRHYLDYRPLCASNGESYANNSDLECDKCNFNYDIVKVHDGYCDGYLEKFAELEKMQSSTTPKYCDCIYSNNYEPLCGSNGKSYLNNVELECDKKCINNYDIVKIHDGYCEEYL